MLGSIGSVLSGVGAVGGLFGGGKSKGPSLEEQHEMQRNTQKYLWEIQVPSLVKGAVAAGLHPLVGAGVNPSSAAGVGAVVGDDGSPHWSERLANAGQNLSRAAGAVMDKQERAKIAARDALLLDKMKLENELLRSQITTVNRSITPPVAGDSLGSSQGAEYGPVGLNSPTGPSGSKEGGATTDFTYSRTSNGGLTIVPSSDVKNRIEDMLVPELQWSWRNTHLFKNPPYPDSRQFPVPKGYDFWRWNNLKQEWQPYKKW